MLVKSSERILHSPALTRQSLALFVAIVKHASGRKLAVSAMTLSLSRLTAAAKQSTPSLVTDTVTERSIYGLLAVPPNTQSRTAIFGDKQSKL
jgi:hypothetical protein